MLKKLKKTQEQWGGSSDVIDHWLAKRQELIVAFCKLAYLQPSAAEVSIAELPSPTELQVFCQDLVDYISEGHFKIYDMVMNKWHATGFHATEEMDSTYGDIIETNEPLLSFTDKYSAIADDDDLEDLDHDLSEVGEVLEQRFNIEDYLIQLIADSLAVPPGA
ncbi:MULTISPECIES: sigma D regulator [Vibrio]|uniref:Sigma D regulator n=2 Tax=Vibrio TaxID=662 RepID=A0A7X4LMM1_9VIBR|nr:MULTISPECIES: sigma D regulator [Vibrio]MBF9001280.1 sigma D regulator [Vibrio nitrifigilis]MZI94684.1 sigma D regulator [Vibrio eleionomae]